MNPVMIPYRPFAYDSDGPSMGEEWWAEHQFEHDFPHGVNNDEWTTEDGRTLKIAEMTTAHIQNVMKMLRRAGEDDDEFFGNLEDELASRKEAAARKLLERERMALPEEGPF